MSRSTSTRRCRPVFIDRGALEHAVINLAINARDAMAEGGMLTFRTGVARLAAAAAAPELPAGAYVMIAVADTGTGMTPPVLARAIDPFFTTKPPGKGSGLGLSQVYGLIRQSGGAVRIESKPGAGTTVLLYLPPADAAQIARDRPDDTASAPEPHADRPALLHIVLLDDEDMVREVVAELLESAGHRVSSFAHAVDALRCVETDLSVALLITDLGLPDCPGEEVARRARAAAAVAAGRVHHRLQRPRTAGRGTAATAQAVLRGRPAGDDRRGGAAAFAGGVTARRRHSAQPADGGGAASVPSCRHEHHR